MLLLIKKQETFKKGYQFTFIMKSEYSVFDAMTRKPVDISPEATLQEAAHLMHQHDVGSLVVKKGDELLGVLTEFDLVRKAVLKALDVNLITVNDIMSKDLLTIHSTADVMDAMKLMRDADVRHLPVLENNKMVGFLTMKDILKIQPQLLELIIDKFSVRNQEY